MAKKAKKSLLASVMSADEMKSADSLASNVELDSAFQDKAENVEVKEEVKYDDVCDANEELSRISNENSSLKDKIAEYLEEIDSLESKVKSLSDERDCSMMKISELTFENATLKARIKELESHSVCERTNVNSKANLAPIRIPQSTNVPYIHKTNCNNGYSDWN